jgi:lactate/malate dehydrogenase, NAD binding domain/AMP-binding enzyme
MSAVRLLLQQRGSAREIVLVNRTSKTAEAVATDIRYGTPLGPKVEIRCGDYEALSGAGVVLITSGVNEKTGGATDRNDPHGRLRLLEKNAVIYRDIVPEIVHAAPRAVLVAVTDPPDPLADVAREASGHDRVLSTGTFLDSLRLVYGPLRDRMGLRRTRWAFTGGAPLGADTFRFFRSIGVNLKQIYGATELCGLTSLQADSEADPNTVGRVCPGIEVRIDTNSEVLVRSQGVLVMIGLMYALIALGFVLLYKATDAINLAQGEFVMFAISCLRRV